jgi:thiol-disulfide isomerase/thioredoxin
MMRIPSFPIRYLLGAVLLLAVVAAAHAAGRPYDKAAFDAVLAQGKPVIVDFAADWCPTCKEQKPIVDALMGEPKRQGIAFFVADFDKEAALKKRLKVTMQSTFIVMKSGKEIARSTGQTDKAELAALFDKAL